MIILFTLHCPKCKVLEVKLQRAGIAFDVVDDQDTVIATGKEHGITSAPILQVDDKFYDFTGAVKYINERK